MNPDTAREQAREILAQRRYEGSEPPRPFERPLRWLGERLDDVAAPLRDLLPGPGWVVWIVLAALVVAAGLALARVSIRRRAPDGVRHGTLDVDRSEDPRALERESDAAERAGDHAAAVRLRFRAGLVRLAAADVIAPRPGLTTGDVARTLRSSAFDALGARFDAIAYGREPADAADAAAARDGWREVLAPVAGRGGRR